MKREIIAILALILFTSFIVAEDFGYSAKGISQFGSSEKPFLIGQNINLVQICSSCTHNNISSILYPDSSLYPGISPSSNEAVMTRFGSYYNYTLLGSQIQQSGTYTVNGHGDLNGTETSWNYTFVVGGTPILFYIFVLAVAWGVGCFGFFTKNEVVSTLGGLGMMAVSVYVLSSGISVYNDLGTQIIGYLSFALGSVFGFLPTFERIEDSIGR